MNDVKEAALAHSPLEYIHTRGIYRCIILNPDKEVAKFLTAKNKRR